MIRDDFRVTANAMVATPRQQGRRSPTEPVARRYVDRTVWSTVLELLDRGDGDLNRVEILSTTDVRIHNRPWRTT